MNGSSSRCWPEARTWAEISLAQVAANWHALRRAAGGAEVAAVVKANAYGHGAVPVARRLEREGCAWFAVSNAAEGAELRRAGVGGRILVMGGFAPFEMDAFFEHRLTPAVHSTESLRALEERAAALGQRLAVHVKLDTGMGRLGTREEAAVVARNAASLRHIEVEGVMSHLASASDFASPQTREQLDAFDRALEALRGCGVAPPIAHIGSSAVVCYGIRRAFHQMVRAGLALYGYVPEPAGDAPPACVRVAPALCWKARIVAVKEIPEGHPVGYNARWRAPRPS
ncbi:MAG: alanine racemase, partial [Bryobacteraceae bacterium]|nr:alanine racemase [Bryobacteraceae bacterium]